MVPYSITPTSTPEYCIHCNNLIGWNRYDDEGYYFDASILGSSTVFNRGRVCNAECKKQFLSKGKNHANPTRLPN